MRPPSMDDELASRFCALYEEWYFFVYKRAFYFFGNEDTARDVAQEVFTKVVAEVDKGNLQVFDVRYLTRVATNLCIDWLRRGGQHAPVLIDQSLLETLGEHDNTARLNQAVDVHTLLARLPAGLRDLAIYRLVDGYSLDELVALTGTPRRTLRRRLDKIKKRLAVLSRRKPASS